MKSKFVLATVSAGLALMTAACGSSSSSPAAAGTTGGAAATTAAATGAASATTGAPATTGGASATGASSAATTGAAGGAPGSITIGSADFSESTILAHVYGEALAAKGVTVKYKDNIGERAAYIAALSDGSIDYFPEYSGSILYFFDPKATAKTPADVYAALKTAATAKKLTALNYAQAQDSDTITVTKATADKYNLTTISSLVPVAGKLTYGAPPNMQTRADGIPGFQATYGLKFGKFTPLAASGLITQTALKNNAVDAADIFSTDPSIVTDGFVSLKDDKSVFAAQNIVPLVTTAKVTPTITSVSNAVSSKLTTIDLATLVNEVQTKKMDPDAVAKAYVSSHGLS